MIAVCARYFFSNQHYWASLQRKPDLSFRYNSVLWERRPSMAGAYVAWWRRLVTKTLSALLALYHRIHMWLVHFLVKRPIMLCYDAFSVVRLNKLFNKQLSCRQFEPPWRCHDITVLWYIYVHIQYIPRNMHTVFALLCFVVVIHSLIFPYPSGLLHWHCCNLTIAPVPVKQPWWIWMNTSYEFIMNDCVTTTKQSTTKPCAYFLGYTVHMPITIIRYAKHIPHVLELLSQSRIQFINGYSQYNIYHIMLLYQLFSSPKHLIYYNQLLNKMQWLHGNDAMKISIKCIIE